MKILEWLAEDRGVGMSSKAIALTALGAMPTRPSYPHDGDDFGRCYRLLALCPDAKAGLNKLGKDGGPYWRALVARWSDIEAAYLRDEDRREKGNRNYKEYECYKLMQAIVRPIEDSDPSIVRGNGYSVRFGTLP